MMIGPYILHTLIHIKYFIIYKQLKETLPFSVYPFCGSRRQGGGYNLNFPITLD